ncbi:NAD(P)/FAD-dependent oxidoreductase [Rhodococcus aetherivorans]|uniref:NAD(P)/FAD-dependent oxidoreductase n=1 Tax=Rhodococcus aetherivorans TaxID=191292 RepID=UPI00365B77C5
MTRNKHHVVVGAGAAGLAAASAMRDNGFAGRITVFDADPHTPYERPPLSKEYLSDRRLREIVAETEYRRLDIELRVGVGVRRLRPSDRRIDTSDGEELVADRVLLTTGVAARRLDVPGAALGNILTLRDAADAAALSARLRAGGPLVVVGGGFVGLEVAAAAVDRGIDVTVVELGELPLLAAVGPEIARRICRLHTERGVRILTRRTVDAFAGSRTVESVRLSTGERLDAATVVVGCGVVPNDGLARQAGVACADGITVDDLGRSSDPWIWAAGDIAAHVNPHLGHRGRIEHWDVARRHGAAVGASMAGNATVNREIPYFWSHQYQHTLQMYGRGRPGDRVIVRDSTTEPGFVAFWVRDGRVAAAAALDEPRDVRSAKILAENRIAVPDETLRFAGTDLRRLVRQLRSPDTRRDVDVTG